MNITGAIGEISGIYPRQTRPAGKSDSTFAELLASTNEPRTRKDILHLSEAPDTNKYFWRADENDTINYRGTIFFVDREHNDLKLGDCSDPRKCLRIPLSGGGNLVVNRENLEDLKNAISMFSSEDVGRILRAIEKDQLAQQNEQDSENEADDQMLKVIETHLSENEEPTKPD